MKLNELNAIQPSAVNSEDNLYLLHKISAQEFEDKKINIGDMASAIPYDNTESELDATNLQDAIDEIAQDGGASSLNDLNDVDIVQPDAKQLLQYNSSSHSWENVKYIEGNSNTASGVYSHAEGDHTSATGGSSHTEGYYTTAEDFTAHAEGERTTASGYISHAEGSWTTASGRYSHSEGEHTIALGSHAHAEGHYTKAQGNCSHAEGNGEINDTVVYVLASGYGSHAEGGQTKATGNYAHAEGAITQATNFQAHSEGKSTIASGENSHAEGYQTQATHFQAHAEGNGTQAKQNNAHAEGYYTQATNFQAHSEGKSTIASGQNSHAEGIYTKASGNASHAEGSGMYDDSGEEPAISYNEASGFASHAEGYYTQAEGVGSHAEGYQTTANGNYSHAGGLSAKAVGKSSFIHGANFSDYSFSFQFALDLSSISDRHLDGKYYFDNACDFNGKTITIKLLNPDKRFSSLFYKLDLNAGLSINDQTTHQSVYGFGYVFTGPFVFSTANNYSISLIPTIPSTTTTIPAHTYITEEQCILSREGGYTGLTNTSSEANGSESIVLGTGLNAIGNSQTVIGTLNSTDDTKAFILGNGKVNYAGETVGTDITVTRSNALTVDWDGNLETAGTIKALNIPDPPTTDGTYTLTCTVLNGVATYSWT